MKYEEILEEMEKHEEKPEDIIENKIDWKSKEPEDFLLYLKNIEKIPEPDLHIDPFYFWTKKRVYALHLYDAILTVVSLPRALEFSEEPNLLPNY